MKFNQKWPILFTPAIGILALGVFFHPNPSVKPAPQTPPAGIKAVTYAEHVAPILNNSCVKCHRPGQSAPFSLIGYENAKRYSDMIALATSKKRMPPWKAVPGEVKFLDDTHLSDEQITLLSAWADAGAPRGDKSKEPVTPTFPEGWALGKPDMLLEMPYEFELGADGSDEYWNFVITPNITKPTYISAIDVEPGNKRIVHHVIAFLDKSGQGKKLVQSRGDKRAGYKTTGGGVGFNPDGSLGGWAPGAKQSRLPDHAGMLIEPGTDIILQVHYNKSGKPEKDQTKVAVYLNQGVPKEQVDVKFIPNPFIRIVPGKAGQKFRSEIPIPAKIKIYSLMPHMHLLGREMKATAIYPDGKEKVLIEVKDWDFNWQLIYNLKTPEILPAGSKLRLEAEYDNSVDNPFQPHDPPKLVRWGEETTDEMMLLVAGITVLRD
ncbi:MAG: hypothetical protein KF824_00260 [Fimbriimonadaceae bacterium]|nr:MAG: hypothetical protein KF824_00260 [Fimbriimonadaceae bacterium]